MIFTISTKAKVIAAASILLIVAAVFFFIGKKNRKPTEIRYYPQYILKDSIRLVSIEIPTASEIEVIMQYADTDAIIRDYLSKKTYADSVTFVEPIKSMKSKLSVVNNSITKVEYEFVPYKSNVTALTRQRRWGVGLMGGVNTDRCATGTLLIHYNFVSVGFSWGQQFNDVNKTQIGIMAGLNWYF